METVPAPLLVTLGPAAVSPDPSTARPRIPPAVVARVLTRLIVYGPPALPLTAMLPAPTDGRPCSADCTVAAEALYASAEVVWPP
jgi:hypothetical protein